MAYNVPTSRGFFGYGCDAVAGIISALILGFALAHPASILVLLAYIAALPLFIVGFGLSPLSSLVATVAGTAGLLAAAPLGVAVMYLMVYGIPSIVLVYLALDQRRMDDGSLTWRFSEGGLLTVLMLYPAVIFLGVVALAAGRDGGLMVQTLHILSGATDQVSTALKESGQTITPDVTLKIQQYIEFFAHIVPAVAMSTWLLVTVLAIVAAQALLPSFGWGVRPAFTLEQLRMPSWVIFAVLAGGAACFAPAPYDYIPLNLTILFVIPFVFTGLAVVHAAAAQTKYSMIILIVFYILIAYLLPFVAIVGAVDQWTNFRKKFAARLLTK